MLLRILRDTLRPPKDEPDGAEAESARGEELFPDAPERSVVVIIYGPSRSNPFHGMSVLFQEELARRGLYCHAVEWGAAVWSNPQFANLIFDRKVRYCISWAGVGASIETTLAGKQENVWAASKTPLFKLMGDHPAYFLDLHRSPSSLFVNVYGFQEHRDFFTRNLSPKGYSAIVPLVHLDPLPPSDIDFEAKKQGKIYFLKNGNDPEALRRRWQARLPSKVAGALLALSEELLASLPVERSWTIEERVVRYFADLGIDVAGRTKFLSLYIAQLDDYMRRVKSAMIVQSLLDFPIEVHGEKWEHIDFSGRRATLVPYGDYTRSKELIREALAVLDMSPNTYSLPHERFVRCASRHTLCLTNHSEYLAREFAPLGQPLFDFTPDSIRATVGAALEDPHGHVEAGRRIGAEFKRRHSLDDLFDFFDMLAEQIGVQEGGDPMIQEFFSWPPQFV